MQEPPTEPSREQALPKLSQTEVPAPEKPAFISKSGASVQSSPVMVHHVQPNLAGRFEALLEGTAALEKAVDLELFQAPSSADKRTLKDTVDTDNTDFLYRQAQEHVIAKIEAERGQKLSEEERVLILGTSETKEEVFDRYAHTPRPLSARAHLTDIKQQYDSAESVEQRAVLLEESTNREELLRQAFQNQESIVVEHPTLGENTSRLMTLHPPEGKGTGKPPIIIFPTISAGGPYMAEMAKELALAGNEVVVAGFPEEHLGEVSDTFTEISSITDYDTYVASTRTQIENESVARVEADKGRKLTESERTDLLEDNLDIKNDNNRKLQQKLNKVPNAIKRRDGVSYAAHVEHYKAIVEMIAERYGVKGDDDGNKVRFVGLSTGSSVALEMLTDYPDIQRMVSGALLIAPVAVGEYPIAKAALGALDNHIRRIPSAHYMEIIQGGKDPDATPKTDDQKHQSELKGKVTGSHMAKAGMRGSFMNRLGDIHTDIPITVVALDGDKIANSKSHLEELSTISGLETGSIEGVHLDPTTHPRRIFDRIQSKFGHTI